MPPVSSFAEYSFLALVAIVATLFIYALRRAGGSVLYGGFLVFAWLFISAMISLSGVLAKFNHVPPPFLIFVALFTVLTTLVAISRIGTRLIKGVGIRGLIGYQAFRFPLELLLHRLYSEGVSPVQMTYTGRNFDIVTGILAFLIGFWPWPSQPPRWIIWAFNLSGLALLINIVTIAILSTPTPMRRFFNEPANTFVVYMPFVWLPAFLVQAAWFGHLLVFRWLRQSRDHKIQLSAVNTI